MVAKQHHSLTSDGGSSMQAEPLDIAGEHHSVNRGGVSALLSVQGDEPAHAAIHTVGQLDVPVEADTEGGGV